MGSQLRKLRAKAGVTGESYQREQRRHARNREVLKRIASASPAAVTVSFDSRGGQLRSSEQLRESLARASASGAVFPALSSEMASHRIRVEQLRLEVAHILGSHDGAEELADAIQLAAVKRARESVHPNQEVIEATWGDALRQLRSGVDSRDLTVLKGPKGLEVYAKAQESAAAFIAQAPPSEFVKTTVSGEGTLAPPVAAEPAMRLPQRRMPPLATLALLGMMGGLAVPPRRDR